MKKKILFTGMAVLTVIVLMGCANFYFPWQDKVVNISAISGVTVPVKKGVPVTTITETEQYSGTVNWNGSPSTFSPGTEYTATITLTAKDGYTLIGVKANFFTVAGASTVSNSADSGVITAIFPATEGGSVFSVSPDYVFIKDSSDKVKPDVLNTIPAASATSVSPTSSLIVYFNDMIDPESLDDDSITVTAETTQTGSTTISGIIYITVSANGKYAIITFTPYNTMPGSSTITLVISDVKDKGGNILSENETISFTTGTVVTTTMDSLDFNDNGIGVTFEGDGKIISLPMWGIPEISGPYAAAITNGNSGDFKTNKSGTISGTSSINNQYSTLSTGKVTVPPNKTKLVFSYYFVSAEFLEYIGSAYDDNVTVTVAGSKGSQSMILTSVNKFTSAEAKATLTVVPKMTSDSYMTPLSTGELALTGLGSEISFSATVSDVSDMILTSMLIIDNIRFE